MDKVELRGTEEGRLPTQAVKGAQIILAGGSVASLLVLFYFIYHYAWTGERQFANTTGVILYYVLPASMAGLLFASLRLHPVYKVNLALFFASLTASVYLGEGLLQTLEATIFRERGLLLRPVGYGGSNEERQQTAKLVKKRFGIDVDTRTSLEVLADLRKGGVDAVFSTISKQDLLIEQSNGGKQSVINIHGAEVLPLGGISQRETILCNENGPWVTYQSDGYGFNNPTGIWQSDQLEIAALGDSYTHGHCAPPDKNFVALIRQHFPATLNLGVSGNGPLLELATFREYLLPLKPKIVLWFYFEGNDLSDLQNEQQSAILRRYLQDDFSQDLIRRQPELDQALRQYADREIALALQRQAIRQANHAHYAPKLLAFLKLDHLRARLDLVYTDPHELQALADLEGPTLELFSQILLQVKSRVSAWGGGLYFIYLPTWERYGYSNPGVLGNQRMKILKVVNNLTIPIIDMHTVFQSQSDPLSLFPFGEPGHYNEKGHKVVAEAVLRAISLRHQGPQHVQVDQRRLDMDVERNAVKN